MSPNDNTEPEYAADPSNALIKHTDAALCYFAIVYDIVDVVRMLIRDRWLDINAKDVEGRTLLYYAAQYGREEIARELACGYWAFLDTRDADGRTPLHVAIENGHLNVAFMLARCGADGTLEDKCGLSPVFYAYENGHYALARLLEPKYDLVVD